MFSCAICGKAVPNSKWNFRWYVSDNGQRSRDLVCQKCADAHDKAVAK
jgi:DNA-directed RNA polymerase subunit RPC12/RpoP